jgi:hypothetical protein
MFHGVTMGINVRMGGNPVGRGDFGVGEGMLDYSIFHSAGVGLVLAMGGISISVQRL